MVFTFVWYYIFLYYFYLTIFFSLCVPISKYCLNSDRIFAIHTFILYVCVQQKRVKRFYQVSRSYITTHNIIDKLNCTLMSKHIKQLFKQNNQKQTYVFIRTKYSSDSKGFYIPTFIKIYFISNL